MRKRGVALSAAFGVVAVSALFLGFAGASAEDAPRFQDYPVDAVWNGVAKKLVRDTEFARQYRTRLKWAADASPDFAGHYTATSWGCGGGGCIFGGVVDLETGKAVEFPQVTSQDTQLPIDDEAGVRYNLNSRLMVFKGIADEAGVPSANYYLFEGGGFRLIHSEPLQISAPVADTSQSASFNGYECKSDCSGHLAGYHWAEDKAISDASECAGNSTSFIEGCVAYVSEQQQ